MKKTKIFIAAIAILAGITTLFTACKKKDSSSSSSTTSAIVGKWEMAKDHMSLTAPVVYSHDSTYPAGNGEIYNFYASNSFSYYSGGTQSDSGTYSFSGNRLITIATGSTNQDTITANVTATTLDLSTTNLGTGIVGTYTITYNKR